MGDEPVSAATLMRMATHYLAQRAASTRRLEEVLARKIRRRCEARAVEPPTDEALAAMIAPVIRRLVEAHLLDDASYASGRAASLAAKGRPSWRIRAELHRQGIDTEAPAVAEAVDLDPAVQARIVARRRRLGPYRAGERAPYRERDIAVLARAGFALDVARRIIDGAGDADAADDADADA